MEQSPKQSFYVERLQEYCDQDAAEIGLLMQHLSADADTTPIPEDHLRTIIESPNHEQLVARGQNSRIIGAATLSIVMGARKPKGYLEDFVSDPTVGQKGIGQAVWNEMESWCREHEVDLHFTSKPNREAAHNFYTKNGAQVRATTVFKKTLTD